MKKIIILFLGLISLFLSCDESDESKKNEDEIVLVSYPGWLEQGLFGDIRTGLEINQSSIVYYGRGLFEFKNGFFDVLEDTEEIYTISMEESYFDGFQNVKIVFYLTFYRPHIEEGECGVIGTFRSEKFINDTFDNFQSETLSFNRKVAIFQQFDKYLLT